MSFYLPLPRFNLFSVLFAVFTNTLRYDRICCRIARCSGVNISPFQENTAYGISQVSSTKASAHSASLTGFLARKLIPKVPKLAALDD